MKIQNNQTKKIILAIDGKCGSGKSTLAEVIASKTGGVIISLDDFFLPLELRTLDRQNRPGGNVHYERFLSEVLVPLREGKEVCYGIFDCKEMKITSMRTLPESDFYIVEGSYSMRLDFLPFYNVALLLGVSEDIQKDRIGKRNGPEGLTVYLDRWIPLENQYFDTFYSDYMDGESHLFYIP